MSFYRPKFILQWRDIIKTGGIKLLIRKKGWVILVYFFLFYLVRDSILYILIPYLGLNYITSCFSCQPVF